jgi:hypothetical protein
MVNLQLPIWFVMERQQANGSPASNSDPGGIYAFSDITRVMAFIINRQVTKCVISHVKDRSGLDILVAEAHSAGASHIRVNPDVGGSRSERIVLSDLIPT